jgi:hypothetical protein
MKAKGNDQSQAFGTCNVVNGAINGARQEKKKEANPAGYRTRVARFVVELYESFSKKCC